MNKSCGDNKNSKNECVQVVVRCRPMNNKELNHGYPNVAQVRPAAGVVEIFQPSDNEKLNGKMFTFDAAYGHNCTQEDIYDLSIRPLVDAVLSGFNGTIFAYGQTGTGKTYTMEGHKAKGKEYQGVIPRSFEQIFNHISRTANMQFLVRASYLEIYQDEIRDLLDKDAKKKLELREDPDSGVFVKDLSSHTCKSISDIEGLMKQGNLNRTIGATDMNEHSSRSHAIFMVTIEMSELTTELENQVRVGKLNLVDLAGSERQSKTGSSGTRLKEASKINLALSALGNVISALVDGKGQHIPYRDSKLTRLLQDSLGGNSKTLMIANIGPASYNYEESLTTLRYANRAKNIKNKPRINEDPKDAMLRKFQEEIKKLKALLQEQSIQKTEVTKKKKKGRRQDGMGDECDISIEGKTRDQLIKEEEDSLYLKEKKLLRNDISESERNKLLLEIEEKKAQISAEKKYSNELAARIKSIESKLLMGGKNIIDHTNEQQKALEHRNLEINERKRREIQMKQMLESKEETMEGVRETYTNLQQEVEAKNVKVKKLYQKLQSVKQEMSDLVEVFNSDRRELESSHAELLKDYKLRLLIIENFIPPDERKRISSRLIYDDEEDVWKFMPDISYNNRIARPISCLNERRPITEQAKENRELGLNHRYKAESIISLPLEILDRTTSEYSGPAVAPSIMSALEAALKGEEDIDVDAAATTLPNKVSNKRLTSGRPPPSRGRHHSSAFPKARGLVPK